MAPHDPEPTPKQRARANTTFSSFPWRRGRESAANTPGAGGTPSSPLHNHLSLDDLLTNLTPPAVPSLATARALSVALSACPPPENVTSVVNTTSLIPILSALCAPDRPPLLRQAGYEILASYMGIAEGVHPLSTSDRLTFFSLFNDECAASWVPEVWEARARALKSLVQCGEDMLGIECLVVGILEVWIEAAYGGLLVREAADRTERERSVDSLAAFLTELMSRPDTLARLSEADVAGVLAFFASIVDRALALPSDWFGTLELPTQTTTPTRLTHSHRRHPSSASIPLASPTSVTPLTTTRRPLDLSIPLYLNHLDAQRRTLQPVHLQSILPILFRALAFYSSPLPRLSINDPTQFDSLPLEREISKALDPLLNGPYTSTCFLILKRHLLPPPSLSHPAPDPASPSIPTSPPASPPQSPQPSLRTAIQSSTGAIRALRLSIRLTLRARLARSYIARMSSDSFTHSGAPGQLDLNLETDLMERAWAKDEVTKGDLGKVGRVLRRAAEAWAGVRLDNEGEGGDVQVEDVLLEIVGVLKDVFQEYGERGDNEEVDEEEANVVGEILQALCGYIAPLKDQDGNPYILPLTHPSEARNPLLRELSSILSRDPSPAMTPCNPPLSSLLLSISSHLSDADSAKLLATMYDRTELFPNTLTWSSSWALILSNTDDPCLCSLSSRPLTRRTMLEALQETIDVVRDIPTQREVLVDMVLQHWKEIDVRKGEMDGGEIVWNVLADEVVLRQIEAQEDPEGNHSDEEDVGAFIDDVLELMTTSATEGEDQDLDSGPTPVPPTPHDVHSPTPGPSVSVSPALSRVQSMDTVSPPKEKEQGLISIFSSFAPSSRSHPPHPPPSSSTPLPLPDDAASVHSVPLPNVLEGLTSAPSSLTGSVGAVVALLHIFTQLSFTPHALSHANRTLAVRVFSILVSLLTTAKSSLARLTVLQFVFRLRVDRDHRLFSSHLRYDRFEHISTLAGLIGRHTPEGGHQVPENGPTTTIEDMPPDILEAFKNRARAPEREERRSSRGREAKTSHSRSSRSRSRAGTGRNRPPPVPVPDTVHRIRKPIWRIPEHLPFSVPESDTPSDGLISYDPDGPGARVVLPISTLLLAFIEILQAERDWEILSYVLCHLPSLLANKHLFCGPKSRQAISRLTDLLCTRLSTGELGNIAHWPPGLKARDANGLAYHTLSILISYRKCFDPQKQHILVEVFMIGLNGQQSTIKCCLHALSLSAFELPDSTRRFLPDILTKLSQIMTNATIAVHIIALLAIVGSLPALYANFTESHFRLVFGVALQYLRLHNQPDESAPNTSWALSQHVRIMSYYILYLWFLAVKLPDRPKHVRYITRQLLLANEGRKDIDEFAEVCFDWLARYTYSSADPRPADSMLKDMVMNPADKRPDSEVLTEKTWIVGTALVTIKTLTKIGWIEVVARRASGLTRVLARIENLPMVGPGDVDPDMISVPAVLAMDREVPPAEGEEEDRREERELYQEVLRTLYPTTEEPSNTEDAAQKPDPITGYVWQGQAPSQRRKEVAIDPSYFALQLTPYPDKYDSRQRAKVVDSPGLPMLIRTLDRMPVIDTHSVGVMYVAPGQTKEHEILANTHGSPAYSRFLEGLGRLINLRGQKDVYAGGLDPEEDGEYAYAWWDDIGQVLYHTATLMPSHPHDPQCTFKKRHIGNDYVRIVWNDSGLPYKFDTLATQFQFVNIVIEPHSLGAIAAFSNNLHENEYFRVTVQRAPNMTEFTPVGNFKLISAENLPLYVRQLSLLSEWFAVVFQGTNQDTSKIEPPTNWRSRLQAIKRFKEKIPAPERFERVEGIMGQEPYRDFTLAF